MKDVVMWMCLVPLGLVLLYTAARLVGKAVVRSLREYRDGDAE